MTNKDLQKYAVYKSTPTPWSQEEYEVVSNLMGDQDTVEISRDTSTRKFIYTIEEGSCFLHSDQNTTGKTIITLVDFLGLVDYKNLALSTKKGTYWTFQQLETIANLTGLNRAGPDLEHNVTSKDYAYYAKTQDGFYCWRDQNIAKVVAEKITFPYALLEELVDLKKSKNPCSEICPDGSLRPLGLGISDLATMFKTKGLHLAPFSFSIPARQHGKTVVIDSLMKIIGDTKMTNKNKIGASAHALAMLRFMGSGFEFGIGSKPREKFLTLKVKDGVANAKSLIYQTHSTGIKDPRQFIKDIIYTEIKRVETAILAISFDLVSYGFNIKLAAQVAYLTGTKAELTAGNTELDLDDVITFYEFEKENASYSRSRERNEDVCPFNWIKDHLTHDRINKPGKHRLFTSNKIRIFIKNGEIHYHTNDAEFNVDIKFNPESDQFSF